MMHCLAMCDSLAVPCCRLLAVDSFTHKDAYLDFFVEVLRTGWIKCRDYGGDLGALNAPPRTLSLGMLQRRLTE